MDRRIATRLIVNTNQTLKYFSQCLNVAVEMGCRNSHFVQNSMTVYPFVAIGSEKTVIPITAEQIRMVQETWEIIEPHKKQFGLDVFTR